MSKLDLHIHSAASDDGEYTPQEIVAMSRAQGMELIAITDHNSVRSVAAAQSEAFRPVPPPAFASSPESSWTAPIKQELPPAWILLRPYAKGVRAD